MPVTINVDASGINEIIQKFKKMPHELERARNSAMKEVKDRTRGFVAKQILKVYNLEKSVLTSKLKEKTKVSKDKLGITFRGARLGPTGFKGVTPNTPPAIRLGKRKQTATKKMHRQIPYEINVQIKKGSPKTLETNTGRNGASYFPFLMKTGAKSTDKIPYFIAQNQGYKKSNGKSVVSGMRTVSIPQIIANEKVHPAIQDKMTETFMKRFAQQAVRFKIMTTEQKNEILSRNGIKIRGR